MTSLMAQDHGFVARLDKFGAALLADHGVEISDDEHGRRHDLRVVEALVIADGAAEAAKGDGELEWRLWWQVVDRSPLAGECVASLGGLIAFAQGRQHHA